MNWISIYLNRFVLAMLATLVMAATVTADERDQADRAKELFDTLYNTKIAQAQGTVAEVELAQEMLTLAKRSTSQPALLQLLCESAHDLGARHTQGFTTAVEALELLAQTVPDARQSANEKLVALLTRQMTRGKNEERGPAADSLISLLTTMGDEKVQAKRYADAVQDFRRALQIARQRRSRDSEIVQSKLDAAMAHQRTERQIDQLRSRLEQDPTDHETAKRIVTLYLIELNDPATAAAYLDSVDDEQLTKLATLATKPVNEIDEADCLTLGTWFKNRGDDARHSQAAYQQARKYLSRFLELHTEQTSLDRIKAEAMLRDIESSIDVLGPEVFVVDVPGTHHQPHAITVTEVTAGTLIRITPVKGRWTKGSGSQRGRSFDWKGVSGEGGWLALGVKLGEFTDTFSSDQMEFHAKVSGELKLYCSDDEPSRNTGSIQVKVEIWEP